MFCVSWDFTIWVLQSFISACRLVSHQTNLDEHHGELLHQMQANVGFAASVSADSDYGPGQTVVFDVIDVNIGGSYGGGIFTCPITGNAI